MSKQLLLSFFNLKPSAHAHLIVDCGDCRHNCSQPPLFCPHILSPAAIKHRELKPENYCIVEPHLYLLLPLFIILNWDNSIPQLYSLFVLVLVCILLYPAIVALSTQSRYRQICLNEHLYITSHCLLRASLYNKSLSIKGTSIQQFTVYKGHVYITNHCLFSASSIFLFINFNVQCP